MAAEKRGNIYCLGARWVAELHYTRQQAVMHGSAQQPGALAAERLRPLWLGGEAAAGGQPNWHMAEIRFLVLLCSARTDQYNADKEALLRHIVDSFRVR